MESSTLRSMYAYCEQWSHPESEILHQLERDTFLNTPTPQMLSGKLQGRMLSFLSQLKRPHLALDIGGFTGYSARCIAEGLSAGGTVHSIEITDDYEHIRRRNLDGDPIAENIVWHHADAIECISKLDHPWDFVFVDAAKSQYPAILKLLEPRMKAGALLVADNVLWYGKVLSEPMDAETKAVHLFNQQLHDSPAWQTIVLPVRDGWSLSVRR
ncbi:MAG: O-methyltransferase [Saprospiraceae bacterium]|nr:O-methyltransferase [Saprospiraceae bacterium]